MPGWAFPRQSPPVMSRSITGGSFFGSSLIVPSSRLVPAPMVYLSPLNDHVHVTAIGRPNCVQDSIVQSPSSFLRSPLSSLATFGAGAAVAAARPASPTASHTDRFIGHLRGRAGPLYASAGGHCPLAHPLGSLVRHAGAGGA